MDGCLLTLVELLFSLPVEWIFDSPQSDADRRWQCGCGIVLLLAIVAIGLAWYYLPDLR